MEGTFIVFVIIVIAIAVIMAISKTQNQDVAANHFENAMKMDTTFAESVIKVSDADIREPIRAPGKLVLAWDRLRFFGPQGTYEVSIADIRSVAVEHGSALSILQILAAGSKLEFSWDAIQRSTRGLGGTTNSSFGVGFGLTSNANPLADEWRQIIDDVRFGRIKKI